MNLKDLNKIIGLYDSVIFSCNNLIKVLTDEKTRVYDAFGNNIKEDLLQEVEKIKDKTINVLKCGVDKE